jgi:hypothetical protein
MPSPIKIIGGIIMTPEEYYKGEPHDDDEDDFEDDSDEIGAYLIDEPDDLTLIMMPKLDFDLELTIEQYYKVLKKCKNKDQLKSVLFKFYGHIAGIVSLQNDIQYLQERAKELEFNIKMMQQGLE